MVNGLTVILIGLVVMLAARVILQGNTSNIEQPKVANFSTSQIPQVAQNIFQESLDEDLIVAQQLSDFDILSIESPIDRP